MGERLEQLQGFTGEQKKQRGKKLKVPAGQSYCPNDDEDRDGDSSEEEAEEGSDNEDSAEDEGEMEVKLKN